jgi:hypothetical protein
MTRRAFLIAAMSGATVVRAQVVTPSNPAAARALEDRLRTLLDERDRDRALDAATIAVLTTVDAESDRRFNLRGTGAVVTIDDRQGRLTADWFSYDLPVDGSNAVAVVVTYNTLSPRVRRFAVRVEGERVSDELAPASATARFFETHYGVPTGLATGKRTITVRFEAAAGSEVPPVFALRTVRA